LRSADYPFVLLENCPSNLRLNTVCSDNASGAMLIANHIRDLGYKNIAILTDGRMAAADNPVIFELEHALSLLPMVNKPKIVEINLFNGDILYDNIALDEILRPPFRTEIILTLHSGPVYPLLTFLNHKKLRVPHDVAIISMEEGPGFDLLSSPVTCLRKPLPAMASKVANILWSEIKNSGRGKFKRQVNLAPELVVRSSCGSFVTS